MFASRITLAAVAIYATLSNVCANPVPTPAPFTPSGGLGTNATPPVYAPLSDFDFQSMVRVLAGVLVSVDSKWYLHLSQIESCA